MSNLPPGVSDSMIPGNRPEDELYDRVADALDNLAQTFGAGIPERATDDELQEFDALPNPRGDRGTVSHYCGFSTSGPTTRGMVKRRLENHALGRGSRLMRAVSLRGITWRVVRIWPHGDRTLERILKRSKNLPRYCPVCNGKRSRLRAAYWRSDHYAKIAS